MFTASIFSQLLKLVPRDQFCQLVDQHGSDRWYKRFGSWDHLVTMLAGQFSAVSSLRDLETVFNSHDTQHYHLGCNGVRRSTLSDANKQRDSAVFRDLAMAMLSGCKGDVRELRSVISVLDSSPIRLSGRGHDWALASRTRSHNQGLKLHVQMAPQDERVEFIKVTDNTVNDINVGRGLAVEPGRIYVFDKGYCDYNWWNSIDEAGASFVTRLKVNAAFEVIEERVTTPCQAGLVLSEQVIRLTNTNPGAGRTNKLAGVPLRLVRIPHPGGKTRPFWIVSNDLQASADEIADRYKQRWSIELLFKWLKQNLQINNFLGENRNAILIQIYVAIIAYLLLQRFHKMVGKNQHARLKDVLVYISNNLFLRPRTERWRRQKLQKRRQSQPELWHASC